MDWRKLPWMLVVNEHDHIDKISQRNLHILLSKYSRKYDTLPIPYCSCTKNVCLFLKKKEKKSKRDNLYISKNNLYKRLTINREPLLVKLVTHLPPPSSDQGSSPTRSGAWGARAMNSLWTPHVLILTLPLIPANVYNIGGGGGIL